VTAVVLAAALRQALKRRYTYAGGLGAAPDARLCTAWDCAAAWRAPRLLVPVAEHSSRPALAHRAAEWTPGPARLSGERAPCARARRPRARGRLCGGARAHHAVHHARLGGRARAGGLGRHRRPGGRQGAPVPGGGVAARTRGRVRAPGPGAAARRAAARAARLLQDDARARRGHRLARAAAGAPRQGRLRGLLRAPGGAASLAFMQRAECEREHRRAGKRRAGV